MPKNSRNHCAATVSGLHLFPPHKEGGASDGKLEVNDRFVSVNGYMIRTTAELSAQLAEHSPGDSVKLTVDRNGRLEEMEVTLARGE